MLEQITYKPVPMFIPQETREVIDSVLDTVVDRAWEDISMYDKFADDLRKRSRMLRTREPVQEARIGHYSDKIAMREINSNLIENVIRRLLRDIATETTGVNEMARDTAIRIITGAYQQQRGSSSREKDMNSVVLQMLKKHNKERK